MPPCRNSKYCDWVVCALQPCRNSKYCDWVVCALQHFSNFGAGNETRTRDPDLGKVVLYQLSYSRVGGLCFAALFKFWSGNRDSNSRPRPWQGRALPTELFPLRWSVFCRTFQIFERETRLHYTRNLSLCNPPKKFFLRFYLKC